ncbi:MAG: hypothetical protein RLY31_1857 [Bacteroidota bacterium]|jgi:2-oxoisovalerate dehydrogenase E1 component
MNKKLLREERALLDKAFRLMATTVAMADLYEEEFRVTSKYVHATARGHEAVQLALGLQLHARDWVFPYYRDEAMLLAIGMRPYDLMLQLLAKREDPFSGGRSYYAHPSLKEPDKPGIPHQSSATGMQAIPATGLAMGLQYLSQQVSAEKTTQADTMVPIAVCSLGDASVTEGEVAEAFQMAALRQLPILYLVQDNGWDISAKAEEIRAQDAADYAAGFHGISVRRVDGTDFLACHRVLREVLETIRRERRPFLVHADVPLLHHHTSGVRKEWYRDDLDLHQRRDPFPRLRNHLLENGYRLSELSATEEEVRREVRADFELARSAPDPIPDDLYGHVFAPTPVTMEQGVREPADTDRKVMVDCALQAVEELLRAHPECLVYGQDVGARLGGVFREAATLADKFGQHRVFNTPIQEAFIIGSTVGMSAVGLKPIVEVQFADYIWPGLNQLFTEVSRSCYLSNGKWPVSMVLRVPIGAYGSGGPYHSSSVESVVANIRGVKIAYPSNGADLKGLIKGAYHDPNPVVIFEHKGLYWSKVPGTEGARSIPPAEDYILPLGLSRMALSASPKAVQSGEAMVVVTYGMGVHWSLKAAEDHPGRVSVLDLRTLHPLDEEGVFRAVRDHGRCLVVTEEPVHHSFAQALAGRIQEQCFTWLDAPVTVTGSADVPAIPLNEVLERTAIPSAAKVSAAIGRLLVW